MSEPKCTCGIPFENHLGILALCAENKELQSNARSAVTDIITRWKTVELAALMAEIQTELRRRADRAIAVVNSSRSRKHRRER
jgi:hypothetical protein